MRISERLLPCSATASKPHLIARGAAIPIRLQLTILLVALVLAVSLAMIFSAYGAAISSVQDEAVNVLETGVNARADAIQEYVQHEQSQMAAALKAVELGCGPSGILNPLCAHDDLVRLLRTRHARAARLRYGARKAVSAGRFAAPPLYPAPGTIALHGGSPDGPTFNLAVSDPESGLSLVAEFSGELLPRAEAGNAALFLVTPDAIYETGAARARGAIPETALRACEAGPAHLVGGNFIVTRSVPAAPGACVVSWSKRSTVLAPVTRLRKELARIGLLFVLGALAIGYILGYVLTRPLSILTRRAQQARKGDYGSPVPLVGSGEIRQLAAALAEMTASVDQTLSALVTAERRLSLACKAARLWLWQHDLVSGTILWFDPAARAPKARTMSFRQFLRRTHPEDRHKLVAAVRSARESGEYATEYRLLQNGRYIWVASWGQATPAEGGKRTVMGGVCLDTTSRRESEHLRLQKEKLLAAADMASELAHQINNPLSAVTGAIYLATLHAGDDPELKKFLTMADQEGKRLANIARQLVKLYNPSSAPEPVDIRELVDAAIVSCERQVLNRRDSLEAQLESTGSILGFREELRQAVLNLLTNAVEHSPESSRIVVRTRRARLWQQPDHRGVRITVANDGPGIPGQRITEMLEPFSGTKQQRGTGLGLWVTRSIVAKHGGELKVRSTPRKTVCVVYLPVRAAS